MGRQLRTKPDFRGKPGTPLTEGQMSVLITLAAHADPSGRLDVHGVHATRFTELRDKGYVTGVFPTYELTDAGRSAIAPHVAEIQRRYERRVAQAAKAVEYAEQTLQGVRLRLHAAKRGNPYLPVPVGHPVEVGA